MQIRGEIIEESGEQVRFRIVIRSDDDVLADIAVPSREAAETLLQQALRAFERAGAGR